MEIIITRVKVNMNKKELKKIAETVLKKYKFTYLKMPRKTAINKCVNHLQKVCLEHPDGNLSLLHIVAKTFFITLNNTQYKKYAIH